MLQKRDNLLQMNKSDLSISSTGFCFYDSECFLASFPLSLPVMERGKFEVDIENAGSSVGKSNTSGESNSEKTPQFLTRCLKSIW